MKIFLATIGFSVVMLGCPGKFVTVEHYPQIPEETEEVETEARE